MSQKMSKKLDQVILQLYARTPAPCRDYCGLTITNEDVVLNVWNITYGPHVYPKRYKCSLEDLKENKNIQTEISRVFGNHVVDYSKSLSNNELKLENLSTKAFLSVLKYVAAKDVLSLSQTSKILFERCNDDKIWSLMFRKLFKTSPTRDDLMEVEEVGWKKYILDCITSQKSAKKKNDVSESKSVNAFKLNNNLKKYLVKSEINLTSQKHVKNNSNSKGENVTVTPRTLLQIKNDLQVNSNNVRPKLIKEVPKIKKNIMVKSNSSTTAIKTDSKTIEKKPLKNELIKHLLESNIAKTPIPRKPEIKEVNKKIELKPIQKKVISTGVEKKLSKINM